MSTEERKLIKKLIGSEEEKKVYIAFQKVSTDQRYLEYAYNMIGHYRFDPDNFQPTPKEYEMKFYDIVRQNTMSNIDMLSEGMVMKKNSEYPCKNCKSKKTYSQQVQTRSADEGMTTFVICLECGGQFQFN